MRASFLKGTSRKFFDVKCTNNTRKENYQKANMQNLVHFQSYGFYFMDAQ